MDRNELIVEKEVVEGVFFQTNGQPGLVNWFGELLTEKYNPGMDKAIGCKTWKTVLHKAIYVEPNNTGLTLLAKASEGRYRDAMMSVFSRPDVPFAFHDPVGNYLYLNGIIEPYTMESPDKDPQECCRFSSPFVQNCIFSAFGLEMQQDMPLRPLDPLDDLSDVLIGRNDCRWHRGICQSGRRLASNSNLLAFTVCSSYI